MPLFLRRLLSGGKRAPGPSSAHVLPLTHTQVNGPFAPIQGPLTGCVLPQTLSLEISTPSLCQHLFLLSLIVLSTFFFPCCPRQNFSKLQTMKSKIEVQSLLAIEAT